MKGNIKKLALLMIITVIAPFILAATVTANPPFPHAIRGQYAATGGGSCITALCGFGDNFVPLPLGDTQNLWLVQSLSYEAVFTFEHDGTGTVSETNRYIAVLSPSPLPSAGTQVTTWSFAYTIDHDGMINIIGDPTTFNATWISGTSKNRTGYGQCQIRAGSISPDGKTITLNGGEPNVVDIHPYIIPPCPNPQSLCNTSAVLIWQHGNH